MAGMQREVVSQQPVQTPQSLQITEAMLGNGPIDAALMRS